MCYVKHSYFLDIQNERNTKGVDSFKIDTFVFKMRGKISIKESINELEEKSTKIVGQKNANQGRGKNPRTY